jgi:hypothetical protein
MKSQVKNISPLDPRRRTDGAFGGLYQGVLCWKRIGRRRYSFCAIPAAELRGICTPVKNRAVQVIVGALAVILTAPVAIAFEAAPYASTMMPTFLTEKSVQVNGRVNPNEMADTYQWFEWGVSGRSAVYETTHHRLWGGSYQTDTNATLVGLAPSTQYFYRAVAENGRGKSVGPTTYFTTKPLPTAIAPLALVATNDVASIGDTTATLRGYVSPHGNTHTKMWFEWGTSAILENRTPEQGSWSGDSAAISATLSQLQQGTVYYVRAVAENEEGRSYGALKVFSTTGTFVSGVVSGEAPKYQYVPAPVSPSEDTVSRNTTTSGAAPVLSADVNGLPQAQNRPGDFFSILFGSKKDSNASVEKTDETANNEITTNGQDQVAGVGNSGLFGNLWNMLTGKKPVEVVVEKVGSENTAVHTVVEYRIAYAYRLPRAASDARLKITLPGTVIYIGDNTNNELLIDTGSGVERTYVLPLGRIENGSTRALSLLGMTTGDVKGFPDARVRLEYTDSTGTHVVSAANGALDEASNNSASVASVSPSILPSSFLGWIAYLLVIVGSIFGVRKAREFYVKRKEAIARAEEMSEAIPQVPAFLPGSQEITPQGA